MVKKKSVKIEWTLLAKEDLKDVLEFYKKKSPQRYNLVKNAILDAVLDASKSPEIFKADNLKKDNDGTVRVFTVYHTSVVYQSAKIQVLRLRHTSREPKEN